jgi:1,4-dihydroxy-2-naphthoate octaprenyltransferase
MMTQETTPVTGGIRAYARLVKVRRYEHYLSIPLCWSLLPRSEAFRARTWAELGLALITIAGGLWATVALDDLQGFRDGTDRANLERTVGPERRNAAFKPLVSGALREENVRRFAIACAITGAGALIAVYALAGGRPRWFFPVVVVLFAVALQYSSGLRLSYKGGQELVLAITAAAVVISPYVLVTGWLTADVGVEALMFGIWMAQVLVLGNIFDREGDRSTGRRTVAAMATARANVRFIVLLFGTGWVTLAVAIGLGTIPLLSALLFLPMLLYQAKALTTAFGSGLVLRGRGYAFTAFKFGVAALFVANLMGWPR